MYGLYRMEKVVYCSLLTFILLAFLGCGSDRQADGITDSEGVLAKGWQEYASGNYASAILSFESVLNGDAQPDAVADAYNGLGWAYACISGDAGVNKVNVGVALEKFQFALDKDTANSDAWVGMASMLIIRQNSNDDLNKAIACVDKSLAGNTNYLYRHDYNSEADLYALKAQCYYFLGNIDSAKTEINRFLEIDKHNQSAMTLLAIFQL